jgi:hypothetical protein
MCVCTTQVVCVCVLCALVCATGTLLRLAADWPHSFEVSLCLHAVCHAGHSIEC